MTDLPENAPETNESSLTHEGLGVGLPGQGTRTTAQTFSRVSAAAISDPRVTDRELRVLAAISLYAGRDGSCYPSQGTVAKLLGISRAAVQKHLSGLEQKGYLIITARHGRNGKKVPNLITVNHAPATLYEPEERKQLSIDAKTQRRTDFRTRFPKAQ